MSRITLISAFKENELYKIKKCLENVNFKTCKVPFGIDDNQRYELDNLPYHITIFATDKENWIYVKFLDTNFFSNLKIKLLLS